MGSLQAHEACPEAATLRVRKQELQRAEVKKGRGQPLLGPRPEISLHSVLGVSIPKRKLKEQMLNKPARKNKLQTDCIFIHLLQSISFQ